ITSFTQRETIKHKRRAPRYFEYSPAPLRVTQEAGVELVLYDFGAVSVIYHQPLSGEFLRLLTLSEELYENQRLLDESRRRVEDLLKVIQPAVSKLNISSFVEDYVIFQVEAFESAVPIGDVTSKHAVEVAQVLRAESRQLSPDEVRDAL